MSALGPIIREAKIAWFTWARAELQKKDPLHADLPEIVRRLAELVSDRPRIAVRAAGACPPGLCAGDPTCPDVHCPGRSGLIQRDGGHVFRAGVAFPIEHQGELHAGGLADVSSTFRRLLGTGWRARR